MSKIRKDEQHFKYNSICLNSSLEKSEKIYYLTIIKEKEFLRSSKRNMR